MRIKMTEIVHYANRIRKIHLSYDAFFREILAMKTAAAAYKQA